MKELSFTEKRFQEIFSNKGNIGPIAEKAHRNFMILRKSPISINERVYHFCVGHAFKNIDRDVFAYKLSIEKEMQRPSQYLSLLKENFNINDGLFKLIKDIRNINSHYIHTFDQITLSNIPEAVIRFLKDAFKLSAEMALISEQSLTYTEYVQDDNHTHKLMLSLCNKFYPNKLYQKEDRENFLKLDINDALDHLLLTEVTEDFEWKIQGIHPVFTVKNGTYLSFHACLFALSLFLYKDEANQLISKIKGFKRTEDSLRYKRDLFTFFSKKFTSQDIHSEEKYLVRFRDIIQYLNHYPTVWNRYLEPDKLNPEMTTLLENKVIETEIFRSFPKYEKSEHRANFLAYAVDKLFGSRKEGYGFLGESPVISDADRNNFDFEIESSSEVKDIHRKLNQFDQADQIPYPKKVEREKLQKKLGKLRKESNPIKEKLLVRIQESTLIKSYGRNQDRFMEIASRYLAENNYFGKDAQFKSYQFYTTDEQKNYLSSEESNLSKIELDKLRYHNGKLVHFIPYSDLLQKYPEWDIPFVVENNAIQVRIKLNSGQYKLFSIQRNLMLYLLENALYDSSENLEGAGLNLLKDYLLNYLQSDFENAKKDLQNDEPISSEAKARLKRLLPKRLRYQYYPAVKNEKEGIHPLLKILQETDLQETRYLKLVEKARSLGLENDFSKKNKGKQFKLRFIRKAWHLMYFRKSYLQQAKLSGHHKRFHITKDEFNDFSRWMYAFEEITPYKDYLIRLLKAKHFFENKEFENLFLTGNSLDDLYKKTKPLFEKWIKHNVAKRADTTDDPSTDYSAILRKDIIYINISHFLGYLQSKGKLVRDPNNIIQYRSLKNTQYLNCYYYYKDTLPRNEYKIHGKLYNKLKTIKLEDSILYEIAMKYLYVDKSIINRSKSSVSELLTSKIEFNINDFQNNHLYKLIVPFNKIESLSILIEHKIEQQNDPKNKKTSFLTNVSRYLKTNNKHEDVKKIADNFLKERSLKYEDLNKLYNHIISGSVKFSKIEMKLEEYFISKNKIFITSGKNFIDIEEIKSADGKREMNNFSSPIIRKKAYHFGVPQEEYEITIAEIEKKFLRNEVKPLLFNSFEELPPNQKAICRLFMDLLHSDLFPKFKSSPTEPIEDVQKRRHEFEKKYFDRYIAVQ